MKKLVFALSMAIAVPATAQQAYPFALPDATGKMVRLADFTGKVVLVDFWFTGCINCLHFYGDDLSKAEQQFGQNSGVVFISICIDKNKERWLKSIGNGLYTSKVSVNLYTGGKGDLHPVIKAYNVTSYPQPVIIGRDGKIADRSGGLADEKALIAAIQAALKTK